MIIKKVVCFFCIICSLFCCFIGCSSNIEEKKQDIIKLNLSNIDDYIEVSKCDNYGYAAFYVYLTVELAIKEKDYVANNSFSVSCVFDGQFSAVLKNDLVTPVHFSHHEFFYINFSKGKNSASKGVSLYNLKYKDYGYIYMTSYTLNISTSSGEIIKISN